MNETAGKLPYVGTNKNKKINIEKKAGFSGFFYDQTLVLVNSSYISSIDSILKINTIIFHLKWTNIQKLDISSQIIVWLLMVTLH